LAIKHWLLKHEGWADDPALCVTQSRWSLKHGDVGL
jgi:hypothetical protein